MVRNLVRQRWQAEGRQVPLDDEGVDVVEPGVRASATRPVGDRRLALLQREAVVLFEFEGLSLEEVAAVAGCDAGTIKSRLFRARERLRRECSRLTQKEFRMNPLNDDGWTVCRPANAPQLHRGSRRA